MEKLADIPGGIAWLPTLNNDDFFPMALVFQPLLVLYYYFGFFLLFRFFIYFMCLLCFYSIVCLVSMKSEGAYGAQELEVRMAVGYHVGTRNSAQIFVKSRRLTYWAPFSSHYFTVL